MLLIVNIDRFIGINSFCESIAWALKRRVYGCIVGRYE